MPVKSVCDQLSALWGGNGEAAVAAVAALWTQDQSDGSILLNSPQSEDIIKENDSICCGMVELEVLVGG